MALKELKLQPPGAGLPKMELLLLRLFIRMAPLIFSWKSALTLLQDEISKSLILVSKVDPDLLDKEVIIKHLFGLEDSSRAWSLFMVIEHVAVVDMGIMRLIAHLNKEQESSIVIDIKGVKPSKNEDHRKLLQMFSKKYADMILSHQKVSLLKKEHPWFGELTNLQWHIYLALHHKIHRRQIEAILKRIESH